MPEPNISNEPGLTQREVAAAIGLSIQQVRAAERSALLKLRRLRGCTAGQRFREAVSEATGARAQRLACHLAPTLTRRLEWPEIESIEL